MSSRRYYIQTIDSLKRKLRCLRCYFRNKLDECEASSGGTTCLNTANPIKTGATTSFFSNDDGGIQRGRLTDWLTLDFTNPFGNTDRFTDTLGGQTYANDVVLNWAFYDQVNGKVLACYRIKQGQFTFSVAMDNQPYTLAGKADWYVANIQEMWSFCRVEAFPNNDPLNYPPLNITMPSSVDYFWCSTAYNGANAWRFTPTTLGQATAVSSAYFILPVRYYTIAELGL